jgi:hypothetical protein
LQEAIEGIVDIVASSENTGLGGPITNAPIARIELRWGARPADLDLHLLRIASAGDEEVHVYYQQKQHGSEVLLHNDVTTGYGPEVVSLADVTDKFLIWVHQYSDDGRLGESDATVDIFSDKDASNRIASFRCPKGGVERWWLVCEIDCGDGRIREIAKLAPAFMI